MESCDICGRDLGNKPDTIQLYEAHLISREVQSQGIEVYTAPKVASRYDKKIKQVSLRVCKRHSRDLLKQRAVTGFFIFLLTFLPIAYTIGRLTMHFNILVNGSVAISIILTVLFAAVLVRLIRYDSLVAVRMNTKAKLEKTDLEYMTENKYLKITGKRNKSKKSPA